MRKEGVANPAQYGKWIRAPVRQKFTKESGGHGGKGGYTNQSPATKRTEKWSHRNEGGGRNREAELVEEERDNSVITNAVVGEEGRAKSGLILLQQSEPAHGKEKEPVTEAATTPIDEEENRLTTYEMIWQNLGDEEFPSKAGKDDFANKNLGCEEGQLLTKGQG